MAGRPQQRKKLDSALFNFQEVLLVLSRKAKRYVKALDEQDYTLPDIARATRQLAEVGKILTELAPFFAAKQNIEGSEHLIEWLLHSPEYTGETRMQIIEAVKAYQSAILQDAGFLEKEQYQLL